MKDEEEIRKELNKERQRYEDPEELTGQVERGRINGLEWVLDERV